MHWCVQRDHVWAVLGGRELRHRYKHDFCPSVIGDVIVYRDGHHITATFARTLAKPLEEGLRRALNVQKPG